VIRSLSSDEYALVLQLVINMLEFAYFANLVFVVNQSIIFYLTNEVNC